MLDPMLVGRDAVSRDDRGTDGDALRLLRTGTAADHEVVERSPDLPGPGLGRQRLAQVLDLMHGCWRAAEDAPNRWAARCPADAEYVEWLRRCRTAMFAPELRRLDLGADPSDASSELPPVSNTDETLGRMSVLEGSTLGGVFIDRHLAGFPELVGVTIRAFPPMAARPGPCGWRSGA
jgi:heme oxygenase